MDGVLTRFFKHPLDYCRALRVHDLPLIEHVDEGGNTHSFSFAKPHGLEWLPGQHGLFFLPHKAVTGKKWRAFSVASAPHENRIMIATTIPAKPSDFKQKLLSLQPGEKIRLFGPYGEFHIRKAKPTIVGVAGGIGITPFRALLLDLAKRPAGSFAFTLIYGGKDDYFAFKDELSAIADHRDITIHFLQTPAEINEQLDAAARAYGNEATYFVSGSPGMLQAIFDRLTTHGITNIVNDPFKGY